MKTFIWILGGAAVASGGVWFYVWYTSPEQRRLRGLKNPAGGGIVSARDQQAPTGTTPTIFHEPTLDNISVDTINLGVLPPL